MLTCPKCLNDFDTNGGGMSSHVKNCGRDWVPSFWEKVDKNGAGGCWNWTASRKPKGYGQFMRKGKLHRAHRLAWTLSGGVLPAKGLELAHRCDNRLCVNPGHLFVATHLENMRDCKAKRRHQHGERNIHAKLTEDQAREILSLKGTATAVAVSKRFNVNQGSVGNIWRGSTWKHLQEQS